MGDSLFHSIWRMHTTRAAFNGQDTHPYESFFLFLLFFSYFFPDFERTGIQRMKIQASPDRIEICLLFQHMLIFKTFSVTFFSANSAWFVPPIVFKERTAQINFIKLEYGMFSYTLVKRKDYSFNNILPTLTICSTTQYEALRWVYLSVYVWNYHFCNFLWKNSTGLATKLSVWISLRRTLTWKRTSSWSLGSRF